MGTTASFSVTATGTPPLNYQWRRYGTNLANADRFSGVTTANLTISAVQGSDAAPYTVVITNASGAVTSEVALLTISNGAAIFTAPLATGRRSHTATLLPDGKVLITGGYTNTGAGSITTTTELYDSASRTWIPNRPMGMARGYHTATLLPSGKVLVVGGVDPANNYLGSAELFDPLTGNWTAAGSLATARAGHTATLLANGKVLIAAGFIWPTGGYYTARNSAELYDPAAGTNGTWTVTGSLNGARGEHMAALLPSGQVLVAGAQ